MAQNMQGVRIKFAVRGESIRKETCFELSNVNSILVFILHQFCDVWLCYIFVTFSHGGMWFLELLNWFRFILERGVLLQEHIVIGTPGTAVDWSTRFKAIDLKKLVVFVLDEADVMIDQQGHHDQSIRIQQYVIILCTLQWQFQDLVRGDEMNS